MPPSTTDEPGTTSAGGGAWRVVAAVLVLAAAGAGLFFAFGRDGGGGATVDAGTLAPLQHIERDGLRYEYDALTDAERLLDVSDPSAPKDVSKSRPADVERLRADLVARLGISGLGALRDAHKAAADELRRLGYR